MQKKDLLELIKGYNSKKKDLFDRSADLLLTEIRNGLEAIYNQGAWAQMVDVNQIGIPIRKMSQDFQKFEIDILGGYLMRFGETMHETYEMVTLQEFIEQDDFVGKELNGFTDQDILQLEPFGKALERKGIGCYADYDNGQLVIAIDVE